MTKHHERRSSIRKPIHHDAELSVSSLSDAVHCIIADYCQEGMFIKLDTKSYEIFDGEPKGQHITVSFEAGSPSNLYSMEAELVHDMTEAIGIRFLEQNAEAIQALNTINKSKSVVSNEESSHIVEECIQCIQTVTVPLVKELMPVVVDELRQSSVKAASDQLANSIMATAEKFEKLSQDVLNRYGEGIHDPLGVFQQHLESSSKMNDSLSVVDKGEFEDWLVTRVLITKSETNYRSELLPLKVRLDAVGLGKKEYHQSPFGPSLLVSAFHAAIHLVGAEPSIEKQVLKLFERDVLGELEALYKQLNQVLINHNILPDLDLAKVVKSQSPKRKPNRAAPSHGGPQQTGEASQAQANTSPGQHPGTSAAPGQGITASSGPAPLVSQQASVIQSLGGGSGVADLSSATFSQAPFTSVEGDSVPNNSFNENQASAQAALDNVLGLMRSLRAKSSEQGDSASTHTHTQTELSAGTSGDSAGQLEGVDSLPRLSEQEMSDGLNQLQSQSLSISLDEHKPLIDRIEAHLEQEGQDKQIEDEHKVAIDVVDRFFLSMRNNPRISSDAKQHLLKLEVPVLKVLLKDERFFDDHSSSVRAVMNRIAQLGAKGNQLTPSSKKKVAELVEKIVNQFEQDTAIFDYVLTELDALISRQNNIYVKNVERVAAAAEGVHKVEEAKAAVTNALNERFSDRQIPAAVSVLVEQGWQDLLIQTHVKYGEESEQWRSYLAVLDELIHFGENPDQSVDTKRILPLIQEGLKQALGSADAPNSVRDALKQLIVAAPRGQHRMVDPEHYSAPESEEELVQRNLSKSQALKSWIIKAKSTALGTWFKFERAGKEDQYIRLVWVAKGYSKFVFVNHQGMKVVELGLLKFAGHLKDKTMTPDWDYEQPMVNQSLDNMVKDVYDKLAYEASHDPDSGLVKLTEFCRLAKSNMRAGKRTAKCAMLYLRFKDEDGGPIVLPAELAKDIAQTLSEMISNSLLGRANESDLVMFILLPDHGLNLDQLKPALLKLYADYGDISDVIIGESLAHLGFSNPEAMIEHAMNAIGLASPAVDKPDVLSALSAEGNEEDKGNEGGKRAEDELAEGAETKGEALSEEIEELAAQTILESPGANDANAEPEFDDLKLEVLAQEAKRIVREPVEEIVRGHLNLLCHNESADVLYEPVTKDDMKQLDDWWIAQLEKLVKERHPAFEEYEFLRVSLSAYALEDKAFCDHLEALASVDGLPRDKVCFDVYEGSAIEDVHEVAVTMRQLTQLGYRFSLDHFGSERSPFAFLKALPFFMINIDESFVQSISENQADEIAADSIAEIAHYLGKKVLATAVDSAICAQKMKKLKVDYIQGSTVSPMGELLH